MQCHILQHPQGEFHSANEKNIELWKSLDGDAMSSWSISFYKREKDRTVEITDW